MWKVALKNLNWYGMFKGELMPNSTPIVRISINFVEKRPSKNFCGIFIIFHNVMKWQIFQFEVSDAIPANIHNISPLVSLHVFVNFIEKEPSIKFYGIFDHFSWSCEATKFWIIGWWTFSPWEWTNNMLFVP